MVAALAHRGCHCRWLQRFPQYTERVKRFIEEDENGFFQIPDLGEAKTLATKWMTTTGSYVEPDLLIATLLDNMNQQKLHPID